MASAAEPAPLNAAARITVVYDNVPHALGMRTAWGFSALVDTGEERVLFDTGADGEILLHNLARLGIAPESIDAVVLSHSHGDHTGGLEALLDRNSVVTVYVPASFGKTFEHNLRRRGTKVETVGAPRHLRANLYSTGEMGEATLEQALIVETPSGLVVLTGCAHPGVVEIALAAQAYRGQEVQLLLGGFHLRGHSPRELDRTLQALRALDVHRVAPSHCTGERAIERFREDWGEHFIPSGCGAVIEAR
jgi:7,8-dihydropterin-6-yl-methyl-4-(beta-D-ribofuranosyl)aminobenzene 5'-phosphate synthase